MNKLNLNVIRSVLTLGTLYPLVENCQNSLNHCSPGVQNRFDKAAEIIIVQYSI